MFEIPERWNVPILFRGGEVVRDATNSSWNDGRRLSNLLRGKILSFRIGRKTKNFFADRVQFEKDCLHVEATLDEFLDWNENRTLSNENPFKLISNETFFAYGDYIHLAELLNESDERLFKVEKEFSIARTLRFSSLLFVRFDHEKLIDWSDIGLNERDGNQSTLWIGSQGSHTPCHYDTYGINFVAQIVGKKRWLLFPPNSPLSELQTRIPYEESSVYIDVEPSKMKKFQSIDVFDVTLQPGDVLFVPKHWWHFVSSVDSLTISVNSWVEQPNDDVERIKEMLVRQIITSTIVAHDSSPELWFNHNEVVTEPSTNLTILSNLIHPNENESSIEPLNKRFRSESKQICPKEKVEEIRLEKSTFSDLDRFSSINESGDVSNRSSSSDDLLKLLLKAMTNKETIDLIYQKLR